MLLNNVVSKSAIQTQLNSLAIANSNGALTSVREGGRLNAINGALASVLTDFYRSLQLGMYNNAVQGLFELFGFSALPGRAASVTLSFNVTGPTTIPQGFVVSTLGNPSSPAIQFQTTSATVCTGAGTYTAVAQATQVGTQGNVPEGTITNLLSSSTSVVAVTNPSAALGGQNPETLSQQQARFQTYVQSISQATATALAYATQQVSGVALCNVVSPQYLTGVLLNGTTYTSYSTALNSPKGQPFSPFVAAPSVGDSFYIGASNQFSGLYIDVATDGSGVAATWEYYNGTDFVTLTPTSDGTNSGQQSGTLSFAIPSDWTATTINPNPTTGSSYSGFFIRLTLTSTTFTSLPQWYQAFSNDPPPGYVFIYIQQAPQASNVLSTVQTQLQSVRAAGDTITLLSPTLVPVTVSAILTPTLVGVTQPLTTLATQTLLTLFANLQIGQGISTSAMESALSQLGNGTYLSSVAITSPPSNLQPSQSQLLTLSASDVSITVGVPSA